MIFNLTKISLVLAISLAKAFAKVLDTNEPQGLNLTRLIWVRRMPMKRQAFYTSVRRLEANEFKQLKGFYYGTLQWFKETMFGAAGDFIIYVGTNRICAWKILF